MGEDKVRSCRVIDVEELPPARAERKRKQQLKEQCETLK